MPDGVKGPLQIGVDHLVKIRFLHSGHQIVSGNSRVVDQDVHTAEIRKHLLHHFRAGLIIRYRALIDLRPSSQRADLFRRLLRAFSASVIIDGNIRSPSGKRERDLLSDPASRSGHQSHLSFQHFCLHHRPPFRRRRGISFPCYPFRPKYRRILRPGAVRPPARSAFFLRLTASPDPLRAPHFSRSHSYRSCA